MSRNPRRRRSTIRLRQRPGPGPSSPSRTRLAGDQVMSDVTRIRHYVFRVAAFFGLVAALLWPTSGYGEHDRVPDPPPPTNARLLSYSKLDPPAVTVSGLSSGGFFAPQ